MTGISTPRCFLHCAVRHLCSAMMIIVFANIIAAQTTSTTDGTTPSGIAPGAPAGSYALSGLDSVNLYNGNLNFGLPLLRVGGRGSAGYEMTLPLNVKSWRVQKIYVPSSDAYKYKPDQNQWVLAAGRSAGALTGRQLGVDYAPTSCFGGNTHPSYPTKSITTLTFVSPDETEHELRDVNTNGQPLPRVSCFVGASRGKVFATTDGSTMTFVSDSPITDRIVTTAQPFYPSGYLFLPNGTRYRIDAGNVSWIRDRNGNQVTFAYDASYRLSTITDSLGRQITLTYGGADPAYYTDISYRGFGGLQRTIRVSYTTLSNALRPGFGIQTYGQLFPELYNSSPIDASISLTNNPTVVSSVTLPNNRQYQFFYNSYGEVARIILPTGGAVEYDMTPGSGVVNYSPTSDYQIYRRVSERRVYPNGGTGNNFEGRTTFTAITNNPFDPKPWYTTVTVDHLNQSGTLLARQKHYFNGSGLASLFKFFTGVPSNEFYSPWTDGKEYQTEAIETANCTPSTCVTVLRRAVNLWQQRAPVNWWTGPANYAPANDPHIVETSTTLVDTNQVSKQSFSYDQHNNQTDIYEYDYGSGAPGALVRRSRTDYLVTNSINGIDYTRYDNNIHLRNLPSKQSVYDATGVEKVRTTFEYDNYADDSNHKPIKPRSNISGLCAVVTSPTQCDNSNPAGTTTRGNTTATTQYLLSTGSVTGTISLYAQYDIAGNVVKAIDARGYPTTLDYADSFGVPDGDAHLNSAPLELSVSGQISYAFPTKVTNALGHTAYTQFDYYLGRRVDGEDANGTVASEYFDDLLDRPTQVRSAVNTTLENQTTFAYDDLNRIITITRDLNSFNDPNPLKGQTLYDGLGRTVESRQFEGGTNYITVETRYDSLGRAFRVSNPYRPWQGETAIWTTSAFDALGRVASVTTPDSAAVYSAYSGNRVLVTDQLGKQRISKIDALGQLKDVWEVTSADSATEGISFPNHAEVTAGYRTSYSYDLLNNLTTVTQGTQQRSFVYDSLKRLTSASNPESGTISYQYDSNGNLTQKTDARSIVTSYAYDELNRNTTINYSDTTGINPDITRLYDGATNGKGRLWESYAGGTFTVGSTVEHTKIQSYDALGRPLIQVQDFKANNVWSPAYQTQRTYDLAGHVRAQTYPSGHTVTYNYDQAGRLSDKDSQNPAFTGNLGDGVSRTYSSEILYSPFGGITKEKFGTDTALYNKLFYNSRGQLAEIRESTSYTGPTDETFNRGAIINFYSTCWGKCGGSNSTTSMTDNNGNLKRQEVYIPNNDQIPTTSFTMLAQQYDYDNLNRLQRVKEYGVNQTPDWQQEYVYDRWGNRTLHQTNTWGAGINKKDFTLNTGKNQLGVPNGQAGVMSYDTAGNLTADTYSGSGVARAYDAENRMTSETQANNYLAGSYTYNADGQRVRRKVNGIETWQVYGLDGELVAEYAANASFTTPKKEYGYRNGQLLITADAMPAGRTNVALSANGGVATASSTYSSGNSGANTTNNGDRKGTSVSGSWNDAAPANTFPDWLQIDFGDAKTIDEIDVVTVQDNWQNPSEPTETMTFSLFGLSGYEVQYWTGTTWIDVTGGNVTGNNKVWRKFTFAAITTTKIRVLTHAAPDGYSRITELEAWTSPAPTPGTTNVALASNGATASASSAYAGLSAGGGQDGDRRGLNYGHNTTWSGATATFPQWLQIDFNGTKTIGEIDVFTVQDNYQNPSEPTEAMTFSLYGVSKYDVQYWNGSSWVTVPGGSVTNNNKVWRKFTFSTITTSKIRVVTNASANGWSELTELEAWAAPENSGGVTANINWLVTDQLGTPRIIFDKSGSLASVKRHDYLPFGEELSAGQGLRTPQQGYVTDGVRQKFTQKERDIETGLDYFGARYYSPTQGRFTSSDPIFIKAKRLLDPQRLNLYTYVRNNPQKYVDPTGEDLTIAVTNIVTGTSHVNSRPGGAGTRENVSTYRMTLTNESGSSRNFDVTRDTNYNGPAAQQRGLYGRDSEAPPGDYQGHIRRDGNKGFRVELYDPAVTQIGDRDTINAPDGTARGNIQIHIGPGCSQGCMLLTGGRRGRDAFETAVTGLLAEDQTNGYGQNINVNVQDRNDPNTGDLPNGDRINVPEVNNNLIVVPVGPPPPPPPPPPPEQRGRPE